MHWLTYGADKQIVNLLSILGSNAIAVPLAPAFPLGELRYILDHSGALMLISSNKYAEKAMDTLKEGLQNPPIDARTEKIAEGGQSDHKPILEDMGDAVDKGGMMLYTSGTTSRPVSYASNLGS